MSSSTPPAIAIAIDALTSISASTVQFGAPQPAVVLPVIAGDILYSGAIRAYIDLEFGGVNAPLQDEFARDIVAKTAIVAGLSFLVNQFVGGEVDILAAVVNGFVTFAAGNGVKEALDLQ
jgi:hypothetical protein